MDEKPTSKHLPAKPDHVAAAGLTAARVHVAAAGLTVARVHVAATKRIELRRPNAPHPSQPCSGRACLYCLLVALILIATACLASVVRLTFFDTFTSTLSSGDQYLISHPALSLFCKGLKVESSARSIPVRSYYVEEEPEISASELVSQNVTTQLLVRFRGTDAVKFFLLKGSAVSVLFCAYSPGEEMMVVQGDDNFDTYKNDDDLCSDCYLFKKPSVSANGSSPCGEFSYVVNETDRYYHVATTDLVTSSFASNVRINLNRTVYHIGNGTGQFGNTNYHELPSWTAGSVIVALPPSSAFMTVTVTATCDPRSEPYIILFLLVPLALCVSLFLLIFKKPKYSTSSRHARLVETPLTKPV